MKAMILAAGFGSRLGDEGKTTPKCLIQVAGKSMLEHVVERLKRIGVKQVVINTHHLASQVESYIKRHNSFGIELEISYEREILGTGGGLKKVQSSFASEEFFIMHNADVYSDIDLKDFVEFHRKHLPIASLAVMKRDTSRALLLDEKGDLCGWEQGGGKTQIIGTPRSLERLAFSGIQIISRELFDFMEEDGQNFSIIETYVKAAASGKKVLSYSMDEAFWIDVGTPERIAALRAKLEP